VTPLKPLKLLFTGASSFTGYWFVRTLREAGHTVLATRGSTAADGLRAERIAQLSEQGVTWLDGCRFGDDRFVAAAAEADAVCHHGAQVTNYRSLDFDVHAATAANTHNARAVFEALRGPFIATGSVFEPDEGLGEPPLRAFSPYGLSKGLSWQVLAYWAAHSGRRLHKFVIPNPFGPWEEPRFCAYLLQRWAAGETAQVATPAYVRDNIPVALLAAAYRAFVEAAIGGSAAPRCAPSGYVETQGDFARRFAREIGPRLDMPTPLVLAQQTQFAEPLMRVNSQRAEQLVPGWDEARGWDEAAAYYRSRLGR
jgi:UDP-glucose 4-epimerase